MVERECVNDKVKLRTSWAAPRDPLRELLLRPTAEPTAFRRLGVTGLGVACGFCGTRREMHFQHHKPS